MKQWKSEEFIAKELVKSIREQQILVPQYQRGQIWKKQDKEKLIDSIKKGFPFGTILLYHDNEDKKYRLIDGLQRCTTIAEYINKPYTIFNSEHDIDYNAIENIINLVPELNKSQVSKRIAEIIEKWVLTSHRDLSEIQDMQYFHCANEIVKELPIFKDKVFQIEELIQPMLSNFKNICFELTNVKIPAIVYEGPQDNLPEIFTRINAQGVKLSKYQILAATWSHIDYKITSKDLQDIHGHVDDYFTNLFKDDGSFTLEENIKDETTLNLFQILFGFSKILSERHEYLFTSSSETEVESAAFNLVTACVGLKNNNMKQLDSVLKKHFKNDEEFNVFLEKILVVTNRVERILKPYLSFKINSRSGSRPTYYHTEMQICSIIANSFIAKHVTLHKKDDKEIIEINLNSNNKDWKQLELRLKNNLIKRYLYDVLDNEWSGSGDSKLNSVVKDRNYYFEEINKEMLTSRLEIWNNDYVYKTRERKKVSNPNKVDKLIFSILYSHTLSSAQASSMIKFDFEHLATKKLMRTHLARFDEHDSQIHLPLSAIGNVCLLPEYINRGKREKTIYQDKKYRNEISKSSLTLKDLESKYTFTTEKDLSWIEDSKSSFNTLRNQYLQFIDKRFETIKEKVIDSLYNNPYK